jgi:Mor family transcriptional regulator
MPELIEHLPGELRAIADLIGLPAALRLVEARGGRRLYIPSGAAPEHALVQIVGEEAAAALCRAYAGECLEIPRAVGYATAVRNADIRQRRRQGVSQSTLAGEHRLTERQIRNIQGGGADDRQDGLF